MSYEGARDALTALLEEAGYRVTEFPPIAGEFLGFLTVVVPPAGRTTEWEPGGIVSTTFEQRLDVIAPVRAETTRDTVRNVSAAADAISRALGADVDLGGSVDVVGRIEWESVEAVEVPTGSGNYYAAMRGRLAFETREVLDDEDED